jgi:hypothetical protein
VHHLCLFSLKVIFDLLALPVLLLGHVLVVALGAQVVSSTHAESVADHGGDAEREDEGGGGAVADAGENNDERGA